MSAPWRSELHVEELPAPQRIAPYSAAITADVVANGDEVGSGRFVLLHDPAVNAAWQGTFRCVTFARADVDPDAGAACVVLTDRDFGPWAIEAWPPFTDRVLAAL